MPVRASAFAENSIPCSVRNVNDEFRQISHFQKPQMACPPALTFRARVIYCFWQGRSPRYPAFSAFAVARLHGEGSCFAPYKKPPAQISARADSLSKNLVAFAPAGGKKSEIIFSRDMCVRENTAQAASVEFVRHRHTNSARSRLHPLCRKTLRVFRQS